MSLKGRGPGRGCLPGSRYYDGLTRNVRDVAGAANARLFGADDEGELADNHLTEPVSVEAEDRRLNRTEPTDLEEIGIDRDKAVALGADARGLKLVATFENRLNPHFGFRWGLHFRGGSDYIIISDVFEMWVAVSGLIVQLTQPVVSALFPVLNAMPR